MTALPLEQRPDNSLDNMLLLSEQKYHQRPTLNTAYTVDRVYTVDTAYTVYTLKLLYTAKTFACMPALACMPLLLGKVRTLLE